MVGMCSVVLRRAVLSSALAALARGAHWSCAPFNCSCQGFADYYGTYAGRGFGCPDAPAKQWWESHHCDADAHCPCCGGPACKLPGSAPCICPLGPHPAPRHPPTPPPSIPPPVICPEPLEPDYVCQTCRRPDFSWNTIPVFIHVSKEDSLAFGEADLQVLTKFPIVTIEKWQGCAAPAYTYEEVAMLAAAKSVKDAAAAQRKHISVVVWFDSFRVYANSTLNPDAENSAGIACMNSRAAHFLESKPAERLLHNESGGLVLESFAHLHVVDYQKRAMQVFKRDMCLNMTRSGYVDGCGIDGSQQRAGTSAIPGVSNESASAWNSGKVCFMNGTTAAIGEGLVLGKMEWELGGARGYANGIIQEGCGNSNATVTNLRSVAQRSRALGGVPLVYECHADCDPNTSGDCVSSVAAFLVGAGPYAYWGFGSWVINTKGLQSLSGRWSPLFERKLGDPLGDATYDAASGVWSRRFASGTTATFNAHTNTGTVRWANA